MCAQAGPARSPSPFRRARRDSASRRLPEHCRLPASRLWASPLLGIVAPGRRVRRDSPLAASPPRAPACSALVAPRPRVFRGIAASKHLAYGHRRRWTLPPPGIAARSHSPFRRGRRVSPLAASLPRRASLHCAPRAPRRYPACTRSLVGWIRAHGSRPYHLTATAVATSLPDSPPPSAFCWRSSQARTRALKRRVRTGTLLAQDHCCVIRTGSLVW